MTYSKNYGFGASDRFSRLFSPFGGSGGAAWQPDQLADLTAWFDASDASTIDLTGSEVDLWHDKALVATNLKFTNGNPSPGSKAYYTKTINSLPVVTCDVASSKMFSTQDDTPAWGQPSAAATSVAFVYKYLAANDSKRLLLGGDNDLWFMGPYNANNQLYTGAFTAGSATQTTGPVLAVAQASTGNVSTYVEDGAVKGTATKSQHCTHFDLGYSNDCYSDMAEIVSWDNDDETDRQLVEGYLAHKWGITLPGSHPYFAAAPTL